MAGVVLDTNVIVHLFEVIYLGQSFNLSGPVLRKFLRKPHKLTSAEKDAVSKAVLMSNLGYIVNLCKGKCYVTNLSLTELARVYLRKLYTSRDYRSGLSLDDDVYARVYSSFYRFSMRLGELGIPLEVISIRRRHVDISLERFSGCLDVVSEERLRRFSADLALLGVVADIGGHVLTMDSGMWRLDYQCFKKCHLHARILRGEHVMYLDVEGLRCPQ